jgi:GTPase
MPEYLTPAFEVPMEFYSLDHLKKDSKDEVPLNPKLIRVAIIGPPNSGKSSLVNSIMGEKLTSVSKISHTTSENSVYVKSLLSEGVQILLHDTPGLVPNYTKGLRGFKKNQAWNALDDSDVIVLMVDCNRRLDDGIIEILNKLRKKKVNIEK